MAIESLPTFKSGHRTSILPVTLGPDTTPVSLVWCKASAEAQRAAGHLHARRAAQTPSARNPRRPSCDAAPRGRYRQPGSASRRAR